jgi:hypothetical protein
MYIVRDVFQAKPGKAKDLVAKFKEAIPHMEGAPMRVMTDAVAGYWTVVIESQVEKLDDYLDRARGMGGNPELGKIMQGYMDLVTGGHREVFRLE